VLNTIKFFNYVHKNELPIHYIIHLGLFPRFDFMLIWENMEGEKTLVVKLNAKIYMSCQPILEFDFHR
jgi:hypothetical protein